MQVGSLGDIAFEVSSPSNSSGGRVVTPTEFTRERKARFEEHQVIDAMPRLEFLSPELATMSLSIRLRADMGINPMKESDRIGKLCKEGKAVRLILCGFNFGMYVIDSYSQHVRYASGGGIFSVDMTLNMKEYF